MKKKKDIIAADQKRQLAKSETTTSSIPIHRSKTVTKEPSTGNHSDDRGAEVVVLGRCCVSGSNVGPKLVYVKRRGESNAAARALPITLLTKTKTSQLEAWLCDSGFEDFALSSDVANFRTTVISALNGSKTMVIAEDGHHVMYVGAQQHRCFVAGAEVMWLGKEKPEQKVRLVGKASIRSSIDETMAADALSALTPMLKRNPRLLVTLCVALSADIQKLFGITVPCLGLIGGSSLGKTTIQRVCNLLLYGEERVTMLNATTRGLEKLLADNPERAIFVDDAQGKDAGSPLVNAIMSVGNHGSRITALGETAQVRATLIFSAEAGLLDTARIINAGVTSGAFARVLEIRSGAHGMFDNLCGHQSGAALSTALIDAARKCSQALRVNFLRALALEWVKAEAWWTKHRVEIRARILQESGEVELSEVNSRLVDGLVFTAFTGCLLREFKILNLSRGDVYKAFGFVIKEHLQRQGNQASPVAESVVDDVRYFIQSNPQKFANIATAGDVEARNGMAGFLRQRKDGTREYLFFPGAFRRLFVEQHGEECFRHLKDAGYLLTQNGRNNRKLVRVPDTKHRWNFYVVSEKILRG